MSQDNTLFKIDVLVVKGKPIGVEDSSVMIRGASGYENTVVPNSNVNGADGLKRTRVTRQIVAKILFKPGVNVADLVDVKADMITCKDAVSGRRVMANNCAFGTIGDIGNGAVDIVYNVLEPYQWL